MTERSMTPRGTRILAWALAVGITLVAAILRIAGVGGPATLIFDETYYVKDAWSLWNLGYEGTWGDDPNAAFEAGDVDGYSAEGSFVAHPPVGKWLIGAGMALFGTGPFGWRIATAIMGTLLVPLLHVVAKRLTGSVWLAGVAAALLAIDPLAVAMSRIALLDTSLALFILLAFWFVLLDRPGTVRRIRAGTDRIAGPIVWRRPWIIAAGGVLGLASAVKWSGLYALAVLGIAIVVMDAIDRRRAGVDRWVESAIGRQGPASFVLLVPPALVVYLVGWTGWFATDGGYDRQSSTNPFVALWNYHRTVLDFHGSVTAGHTYASPAAEWILMLNPTLMERTNGDDGAVGLMAALPNPVLWWAGIACVVWLAVRIFIALANKRPISGTDGFLLAGICATYIPWLLLPSRTMFTFYAITVLPFVILAVVVTASRLRDHPDPDRRVVAGTATTVALTAIFLVGIFFLPFGTGWVEPEWLYKAHLWLPSWYL
ncbi:MAG: dolichyl-phosphate-mannose--protein mannosyltransferase [Microbacterium gubbeenense]|uniref:dolichyl-phosphate-mannose--protein mannosyltransferase n=1 Tax=Microbacterium gubbeenense TaxID=159896 RepID=UPI00041F6B23|nr:phospholipid carrier-dependent glycosyltransferase [Microbacterium gubbeenense]